MGDGSDGAGGVGNDGGNNTGSSTGTSVDSVSGMSAAMADAVSELAGAISSALGLDAGALSDALSGLADALGLDAQALQDIAGAALLGAITGGLPGAVMGVVNGLVGGSLTEAARDAVSRNLPESMQPLAQFAIDAFASRVPGANTSVESALASFASGALTNGRMPAVGDIGAISRSLNDVRDVAGALMSGLDLSSPEAAVSSLQSTLEVNFAQARGIAADVAEGFARNGTAYASGGQGAFGDRVEALAVDVARTLAAR